MIAPGLYIGAVTHKRFRAPAHRFRYACFWIALDLDDMPKLRWFSHDRANLFAFFARDHADGRSPDLRASIAAKAEGLDVSGRMILFCMPRMFGFVFNPLSVYFCHDADDALSAVAWEVTNTFGSRHTYVITARREGVVRQACDKRLHVSPFLDMAMSYQFRVEVHGGRVSIGVVDRDHDGLVLAAAISAERRPLTDCALFALAARAPLSTVKVVAAIHWEALRLWFKGARFYREPADARCAIADGAASVHPRADANLSPMKASSEATQ